jgi:adenylate cyclase
MASVNGASVKQFGAFSLLVRGIVWLVGAGVLTLLLAGNITLRADNALYDLNMEYWRYKPSGDVVIVAVDARSIDALGNWPWPRAIHGRLIDRLTDLGVNAIGMGVAILTPDTSHPENDRLLVQALRRNRRVVVPLLSAEMEPGGPMQQRLPIPEVASAAAAVSQSDIPVDDDGLCRGTFLYAGVGRPYWPLLPLAVYQIDDPQFHPIPRHGPEHPDIHGDSPDVWTQGDYMLVRYAGPAGTFPSLSYVDVLNGHVDPALLKGKTVLFGVTAPGIGDRFIVPGRAVSLMPGVEYMANVLESLRRGMLIMPLDLLRRFLFGMVALALPLLIYGWPGFRRTWVVALACVVAFLSASFLVLRLMNVWWPPASAILIVICGALVWRVLVSRLKLGQLPRD